MQLSTSAKTQTGQMKSRKSKVHTFDHEHVDFNGADGRLIQALALLQHNRDVS